MPTGYTKKLMESGQTFQEFVLDSVYAFFACNKITERFGESDFYLKRLDEATEKLRILQAMTKAEKIEWGESRKAESLAMMGSLLDEVFEQNKRLEAMEVSVSKWNPPSADHVGLKVFMLEQIRVSKNSTDYIEKSLAETREKTPMEFYEEAVASAEGDIGYFIKCQKEELEGVKSLNEWVGKLRESIASNPV